MVRGRRERRLPRVRTLGVVVLLDVDSVVFGGAGASLSFSRDGEKTRKLVAQNGVFARRSPPALSLRTSSTHASEVARNERVASRADEQRRLPEGLAPRVSPRRRVRRPRASPEAPARLTNAPNAPLKTTYAASPVGRLAGGTPRSLGLWPAARRAFVSRESPFFGERSDVVPGTRRGWLENQLLPPHTHWLYDYLTVPYLWHLLHHLGVVVRGIRSPQLCGEERRETAGGHRRRSTSTATNVRRLRRRRRRRPRRPLRRRLLRRRRTIRNDIVASEPSSSTTPRVPSIRRTRSRANRSARSSSTVGRRSTTARNAFFGISIAPAAARFATRTRRWRPVSRRSTARVRTRHPPV